MSESLEALRNEMFEPMQRLRQRRSTPPLPPGITRGEINALMMLSIMEARGEAVRPGMLAACSHATPGAVSQTLKSLEEKGLIVRRRGEGDSRSVTISLTNAGREFEKEGRRLHDERFMHMLEFLGEDDAREFVRIVNRMLEFEESHPWKRASDGMRCGGERACAAESVPCPDSAHGQESAVCSDSTIGRESDFRFDSASNSTSETCCNSESSHASASRHPERFAAAGSGFRSEKEGGEPCA